MRRRRVVAAAFVLAVLAVLPAAEASGQADHARSTVRPNAGAPARNPPDPHKDCANTSGKSVATGLPPLPCYKSPFGNFTTVQDAAQILAATPTEVSRPKIRLTIPALVNRAQYAVCLSAIQNFPCPLKLAFPPNDVTVAPGSYYGVAAQVFVRSPAGVSPEYGVFPSVQVAMLAFGSIPVTATVQIRQTTTGKYATPLRLGWFTSGAGIIPGKVVPGYEQYGPAPKNTASQNFYNFEPPPHVTGPVVIQVSNVRVDRKRLDVGPSCQTTTTLNLTAKGGFYQPNPGKGNPGEYSPLGSGKSYLHGNVVVPAFTGCHNTTAAGTEDLDPLITAMVSSRHNRIDVTQLGSLQPYCTAFPKDRTCTATPGAVSNAAPTAAQLNAVLANTKASAVQTAIAGLVRH